MEEDFKTYRKRRLLEMRPWQEGEDMAEIFVSDADRAAGSPKDGDMIARDPENHEDRWLVPAWLFLDKYDLVDDTMERAMDIIKRAAAKLEEREHVTDGGECWCGPVTEKAKEEGAAVAIVVSPGGEPPSAEVADLMGALKEQLLKERGGDANQ